MNIQAMHTQDISDILSAARLCLCENPSSIHREMFRALFGGVFVGVFKPFGEKLDAYKANQHLIPQVLAALAEELENRGI